MIKQLKLKNYILIDDLLVDFDKNLNIITGETGAGKSILLNAIDLIFSARVSKEVIKSGTAKAVIELTLDNQKHDLKVFFEENGIDDWGEEIVRAKEITPNSVRVRINGTLVSQELMKSIRMMFVDIHSQHQTYTFLQPQYHINLLDSYAKEVYGNLLEKYKSCYTKYIQLQRELQEIKNSNTATEAQIDFLKFQINEIEEAQVLSADEDEKLEKELEVLENSEKLKDLSGNAFWQLNGDGNSILEILNSIKSDLNKISNIDNNFEEIFSQYYDCVENLHECSSLIRDYHQGLNNDTQRLNDVQERLFLLDKLKRKYGGDLGSVLKNYEEFTKELSNIENSGQNIEKLEQDVEKSKAELEKLGKELTSHRQNYGQVLSVLIQDKLALLELPKARFEIKITPKDLSPNGFDDVEFMISTNVSEEVKPLAKVASGGEISRVMLAIKAIFAQNDDIDTVIFDEIDTGISGKASQSVADEILELSKSHQIIVITHQPIIAAKANKHFYVKKSQEDETKVEVSVLTKAQRIKAIAELAGGEINDQSLEFAKSLLG